MSAVGALLRELFFAPFREMLHGLDAVLRHGLRSLLLVAAGLVVGWWVYVPLHELLHAFGCLAAGGEVSRLEIAPVYGGGWLSKLFPFVVPGGPYAGRLSGFDSHGSDWIYLATDLAPFARSCTPSPSPSSAPRATSRNGVAACCATCCGTGTTGRCTPSTRAPPS